ncbi:MAG: hypothetical protein NTW10_00615 [Bacteroidetes bacterium]|nr:hypothetical protein [Bacteroidota bacterium]
MKKQITVFAILLLVGISSCKKDNNGQPLPYHGPSGFIKSITVSDTAGYVVTTSSYSYDSQSRLVQITEVVHSPTPDTLFYRFEYSPSRVTVNRMIAPDTYISEKIIYDLNPAGLAGSCTVMNFLQSQDTILELIESCQYDSEGYLAIKASNYYGASSQTTASYEVVNRNYVSTTWTFPQSGTTGKNNYTYDPGHVSTIGNDNVGLPFLGKSSYNPMIKAIDDSTNIERGSCTYQYDGNNRISRITVRGYSFEVNGAWYSLPEPMTHEVVDYTYY